MAPMQVVGVGKQMRAIAAFAQFANHVEPFAWHIAKACVPSIDGILPCDAFATMAEDAL